MAAGDVEARERVLDLLYLEIATRGNVQRAGNDRVRAVEYAHHLLIALDEELVGRELHAILFRDRLAGLNAEHDVLRVGIVLTEIVAVVGGHHWDAEFLFKTEEVAVDALFFGKALVLDLEVEVPCSENVVEGRGCGAGGFVLTFGEALGDLAFQAGGKSDESFGMLGEKALADARLVIEAVHRGLRADLSEVAVALFVFGKDEQVIVGVAFGR